MIIKKVMPKIPVAKKRVAAYCRVSTFRNEQDESFETQQKYYEELIQSHPDWELVKVQPALRGWRMWFMLTLCSTAT